MQERDISFSLLCLKVVEGIPVVCNMASEKTFRSKKEVKLLYLAGYIFISMYSSNIKL